MLLFSCDSCWSIRLTPIHYGMLLCTSCWFESGLGMDKFRIELLWLIITGYQHYKISHYTAFMSCFVLVVWSVPSRVKWLILHRSVLVHTGLKFTFLFKECKCFHADSFNVDPIVVIIPYTHTHIYIYISICLYTYILSHTDDDNITTLVHIKYTICV